MYIHWLTIPDQRFSEFVEKKVKNRQFSLEEAMAKSLAKSIS
jgi:hypothetical protein